MPDLVAVDGGTVPQPCLTCDNPVDRTLPDPIPDGHELMLTESLAGRAPYCGARRSA